MQTLLLRLDGPLQAWGTQGRFEVRDTELEPSKSGVLGLLGCALGMERGDSEMTRRLAKLRMAVRVDSQGTVVRDYHTAGGGSFRGRPHGVYGAKGTVVTERTYLADALFLVGLSGTDEKFLAELHAAVRKPRWPLFLGRKACPPASPVCYGRAPLEGLANEVLRGQPLLTTSLRPGDYVPQPENKKVRLIVESAVGEGEPRQDVPLSFALYGRKFARRFVTTEWVTISSLPRPSEKDHRRATECT